MPDSRLPLLIRPVSGGFDVAFADGAQYVHISRVERRARLPDRTLTDDEALDLAKEIARALMAAWDASLRFAA